MANKKVNVTSINADSKSVNVDGKDMLIVGNALEFFKFDTAKPGEYEIGEKDGQITYIKYLNGAETSKQAAVEDFKNGDELTKDAKIAKQVAIKCAVEFACANKLNGRKLTAMADEIYRYIMG